jgi:aryl-alcohol dehydrogenase-like predicted oxidoreductase
MFRTYYSLSSFSIIEIIMLQQRPLGSQGLMVSQQGLGCMGMTAFYGTFNRKEQETESLRTIAAGLELGINFLDTAWIYQVNLR